MEKQKKLQREKLRHISFIRFTIFIEHLLCVRGRFNERGRGAGGGRGRERERMRIGSLVD